MCAELPCVYSGCCGHSGRFARGRAGGELQLVGTRGLSRRRGRSRTLGPRLQRGTRHARRRQLWGRCSSDRRRFRARAHGAQKRAAARTSDSRGELRRVGRCARGCSVAGAAVAWPGQCRAHSKHRRTQRARAGGGVLHAPVTGPERDSRPLTPTSATKLLAVTGAGALFDLGTLPEPAFGASAFVSVRIDRLELRVAGGVLPEQRAVVSGSAEGDFALLFGALGVCYRAGSSAARRSAAHPQRTTSVSTGRAVASGVQTMTLSDDHEAALLRTVQQALSPTAADQQRVAARLRLYSRRRVRYRRSLCRPPSRRCRVASRRVSGASTNKRQWRA